MITTAMRRLRVAALGLLFAGTAASAVGLWAAAGPAPGPDRPAEAPPTSGEAMAHTCAACHGTFGRLGDESYVPLAGLPAAQFVKTMAAFREGRRPSTLMGLIARGFSESDFRAMGEFFAAVEPAGGPPR